MSKILVWDADAGVGNGDGDLLITGGDLDGDFASGSVLDGVGN